jgi:hypothetical protein
MPEPSLDSSTAPALPQPLRLFDVVGRRLRLLNDLLHGTESVSDGPSLWSSRSRRWPLPRESVLQSYPDLAEVST